VKGTAPKQGTIKGEDQSQGQASQAIPGGGASDSNSNQAAAPDAKEQDAKEQELTAALKKCDSLKRHPETGLHRRGNEEIRRNVSWMA
jgi:hypothetical protein